MVRERRAAAAPEHTRGKVAGTVLCILSAVPLFIAVCLDGSDLLYVGAVCLLLVLAGVGSAVFVSGGVYWAAMDRLLEEGDYVRPRKRQNGVVGAGVIIEEGAVLRDSIIMQGAVIGAGRTVDKGIIAESVQVGRDCRLGVGEFAPNVYNPKVYAFDLVTIAENSVIPDHVQIGKNTAIVGKTVPEDYPDGLLASGQVIIKAGEI